MDPSLMHLTHAAVVRDEQLRVAREHQRPEVRSESLERPSSDRVDAPERQRALGRASLLLSRRDPASRRRTRRPGDDVMLHHHNRSYIDAFEADRRAIAAQRRRPDGASQLDALVLAAAAGDRAAWHTLLERFTARLRAIARRHRLATQDAEDVVQTTWLRLLEHIDGVREPVAVGAWLETTARRESLRVLRAARRERPTDSEHVLDTPVAPVAEQRLIATQDRAALAQALTSLPDRQRRLLSMLFADPVPSYEEISDALGMPIGSIGPTRARSLDRLRRNPSLASAIG